MSFRPFSEPGDGAQYERFADDARYSIHITDPKTGATKLRYDFIFSPVNAGYKNPNTVLSYGLGTEVGPIQEVGDARQNFTQTISASSNRGRHGSTAIGNGLLTPPPNVGKNVTPFYNDADGVAVSGAATVGELDVYTRSTIHPLCERRGRLGRSSRRQLLLRHPRHLRPAQRPHPRQQRHPGGRARPGRQRRRRLQGLQRADDRDADPGQRSRTRSASRPVRHGVLRPADRRRRLRDGEPPAHDRMRKDDGTRENNGGWIQVSRLGNPLFTEGLVAFKDKDRFNRTAPTDDAMFATYARNPELATLINAVYGTRFVDERAYRPREDLHSRSAARRDDDGSRAALRPAGLQPARVHRRRHDERRLGRLAEWPSPRRRRRRHRADGDRERPRLLDDHDGRRQRRGERRAVQPGVPVPRDTALRAANNSKDSGL